MRALFVAGCLTGITLAGTAQRTSETAEWLFADPQEVVQTATRTERTVYESFTTVRVLTRREIELSGAQNLHELLSRMVVDFEAQEGSLHNLLSTRGTYSASEFNERTLFLMDGMPLNDAILGNFSPMSIGTHDIERVEVAFGPGSAMYGPNAFAGVVNLITRRKAGETAPSFFSGFAERGGYLTSARWASPNSPLKVQASFWRDPGSNRLQNNDTIVRSLIANWSQKRAQHQWNLLYGYVDMDRGSVGMRYGVFPTPHDRWQSRMHYWTLEWSSGEARKHIWRFYGSTGDLDLLRTQPPTFALNTRTTRAFDQTMAGLETFWQWGSPKAQYLGGADYRYTSVRSANHLGGSHSATNLALFLQGEWQIGRWRPIAGARYDTHSIYGSQFSPRLGFTYQLNSQNILRASWGHAFRAPSFVELYLTNFPLWTPVWDGNNWIAVPYQIEGNPNLKPEKIQAFELGWKYAGTGLRWDVAYFRQSLSDMVTVFLRDPNQPWLRQFNNLYAFTIEGWSAEVGWKIAPQTDLTLAYMQLDYGGRVGQDYRPARDRAVIRLAHWNEKGWSGQLAFVYPAMRLGYTDAYAWNSFLTLIYRSDSRTRWNLRIDNLFNTPTELARWVPGGGRTIWLTLQRDW
ncbi:MAG: TonB-dependent receptor [Fimbriimonadales bacterium]|nr:TonB-dependent receptor [Fimbriimonadales bacterium]